MIRTKALVPLMVILMTVYLVFSATNLFANAEEPEKKADTKPAVTAPVESDTAKPGGEVVTSPDDEKLEEGEAAAEPKEEAKKVAPPYPIKTLGQVGYALDNFILFICAVLVIFMQAGFAMVEAGFNSAKNVVNILAKNLMDLCVGALLFFIVGFGLMYGGNYAEQIIEPNGYFGFGEFGIYSEFQGTFSPQVDWLFQAAFAATAATIVSGAVAGRLKFSAYLIYSAILTGLIYPISGYWTWGGGWLAEMGFGDFAGSVIVHAVGGFAGLAAAIVLGPRLGRFSSTGKPHPIPGHNLALSTLGVFILWVGWYGFNPGSVLGFQSVDQMNTMMVVATNTTLAAAAGGLFAIAVGWFWFKKPDLALGLNGVLAGLVSITANCDAVENITAVLIGAIGGVLVILGILLLDKLKIDDPVGAFPVHGLCGVWGVLALGLFTDVSLKVQIIGTVAICAWAFITMLILFLILKSLGILRVSPEEEEQGLDICEHGMHAYVH